MKFVHWIALSEKDKASASLKERLWHAADHFRDNSDLKSQEYHYLHARPTPRN